MERKITIEEHVLYKEDYQMKMLKANSLERFLKVGGRGMNGSSYYDYDVSGKLSLKAMYARAKLQTEDIRLLLAQLGNAIRETEKYLLDKDCILLEPEYIFFEEGSFYFCYYPPAQQDIWEAFHVLTEYLVKVADYQDQECVRLVFLLHKETMEENYSLEKLIEACQEEQKKRTKVIRKTDKRICFRICLQISRKIYLMTKKKNLPASATIQKSMTGSQNRRWEAPSCGKPIICGRL